MSPITTACRVITDSIRENPAEIYLIEGHTDTAGGDAANLALSDRRAESVALALTEFFQVPPENMVVQGYGEAFPRIAREGDVRANRRATVRRITDLLAREDADTDALLGSGRSQSRGKGGQLAAAPDESSARRDRDLPAGELARLIQELTDQMHQAATDLHF